MQGDVVRVSAKSKDELQIALFLRLRLAEIVRL
ncbi:hypothetical protein [Dapis sp. BLCC M229]